MANFARKLATTIATSGTIRHFLLGEPAGGFDLRGEKQLDWGWAMAKLAGLSGSALDIGCGQSPLPAALAAAGFQTTAIDLSPDQPFQIPGLQIIRGDFLRENLDDRCFDVIVLCSTVEHMGLSGRYRAAEEEDADLACMQRVRGLIRSTGRVILTVPLGVDYLLKPWHRVYGRDRFPRLIVGFEIVESRAFQRADGAWRAIPIDAAFEHPPTPQRYALGEFVLSPAASHGSAPAACPPRTAPT